MALPLVLVTVSIFAAIGAGLIFLSRSAGRASHWYQHSQMAIDLAQAGMQEALLSLEEMNRPGGTPPPALNSASAANLDEILKVLVGVNPIPSEPMILFEGDAGMGDKVTLGLGAMLDAFSVPKDFRPRLKVEVEFLAQAPLAGGPIGGILPLAAEKQGGIRVLSTASILPEVKGAIPVSRRIVAYRGYKVINILPPVVSRLPIFFEEPPAAPNKLNAVDVTFDQGTGDGIPSPSAKPLLLKNPVAEPFKTGSSVTPPDFAAKAGAAFLDSQGWVFLGNRSGVTPSPWQLNLAFGYTKTGESFHLPNSRFRQLVGGSEASNLAFLQQAEQAFLNAIGCELSFTPAATAPAPAVQDYGLFAITHGFAVDYQDIGFLIRTNLPSSSGTRFDLPQPLGSSALRLMGSADAMSPTVVLGDADRAYVRQTSFYGTFIQNCNGLQGPYDVVLYFWNDHQSNPAQAQILQGSFGSQADYEKVGSGIVREPYVAGLVTMLRPQAAGALQARGYVSPQGAPPAATAAKSALCADVDKLLATAGQDAAALQRLRAGTVKIGSHFDGNLHDALVGLQNLMTDPKRKLVRRMKASQFLTRCVTGGKLKLPGVVLVEGGKLDLPAISEILEGGVVLCEADVTIGGNIQRGSRTEPLTIVSLTGNVIVEPAASTVDAFLVSVDRSVILPPASSLTVRGGIAARQLDGAWMGGPGDRVVEFVPDFDITAPGNDKKYLRAFPTESVQIMVGASE